ncbi:MAG TPA: PLP-dependent transferase [Methylovirgula sp.]
MSDHAPGFATLALHVGAEPGTQPEGTSRAFTEIAQAAALFGLDDLDAHCSTNPQNAALEERITALEGGTAAVALASGQAAQFLVLNLLLQPGDEVIVGSKLGLACPAAETYEGFEWRAKRADPAQIDSFSRALSPQTKAILIDSFVSCGTAVVDLDAIAAIARSARVPLIVDNTFATPYLLRPADHGADIILHSAMNFLGGHETLTGGLIVDVGAFAWQDDPHFPALSKPQPDYGGMVFAETFGNFAFAAACRIQGLKEFGPALSPANASSVLMGLETLALRMQRHSDNALRAAEHLAAHRAIAGVSYPGLADDATHGLAQTYCAHGCGATLACRLAGGFHAARGFVQNLKLFSAFDIWGDARSHARHPASTTHRHLNDAEKDAAGASPDLVRLSIGLEDIGDIIADLDQALTTV